MGYELKMYVGEVVENQRKPDGAVWFWVLGMVELFKVGDSHIRKVIKGGTRIYMYDLDANVEHTEDKYGENLIALDPQRVLKALRRDAADWPDMPTLKAAVAMLEAMLESGGKRLGVVLYGH